MLIVYLGEWQGLGRVQGPGFRVQGSSFRVQGSGFRVQSENLITTSTDAMGMFMRLH